MGIHIFYIALLYLFWIETSIAKYVNGLNLNTTTCEGIFDFNVNSTYLDTTESNKDTYDGIVTAYLSLAPTWLTESCKRAIRKVQCMLAYDTPLSLFILYHILLV